MNTLSLVSVSKKFSYYDKESVIFSNLNYIFEQSKSYALMGPSGSGKSTLLHLLAGIDSPTTGHVYFNSHPTTSLQGKVRAHSIALVLQSSHFINELTVHENAALAGLATNPNTGECFDKARDLLLQVGLNQYLAYPVGTLSGGQRQRLALVCALMNNPNFLIADEVTGNLDTGTAHLIMELLTTLHKNYQCGIILTTHDPDIAAYMDIILYLKTNSLVSIDKNSFNQEVVS